MWLIQNSRDEIVNFISHWSCKLELPVRQFLIWLTISPNRYYDWKKRYNKPNKHNHMMPKSHWLLSWEREAIIEYAKLHPLEGYRRLSYMMLDENIVAVSPSSAYRVLLKANLLNERVGTPSKKGSGFVQPSAPHQHWHSDITYINIACTFYYLISVLDGYSRYLIHWELRKTMIEEDLEITLQRAHE
ncbi:MAG: DDE-type integrase/transposase/recombinase, partial [Promethearchaeota archaeon]